ncbi:MAG: CehA/McbA family metallohydrolase, partial [Clostridia bacterium]|nr:CehA/McbA family metallohydrolase [Clostridia bacterium]
MNKKWHPCELHCHTLHSDGGFTVKELMETAKARQLSGICLTDHNTFSGYEETKEFSSPAVLRGIEWTTYFGHMLVLDCKGDVDWRNAVPDNIDEKMKEVHSFGGLVGIAHPFQLGTPICTGGHWDYNIKDFSLVNYMEIWSEGEPLMTPANKRAKKWWLSLLDKGYRISPTFGRDWHR